VLIAFAELKAYLQVLYVVDCGPLAKPLLQRQGLNSNRCRTSMCEFNVLLNGKSQVKDIVYAKSENNIVTVKSILGETKEFKNCRILEVDVNHERLVLESTKS